MFDKIVVSGSSSTLGYEIANTFLDNGLLVLGTVNSRKTNLSNKFSNYRERVWLNRSELDVDTELNDRTAVMHAAAVVPSRVDSVNTFDFNFDSTKLLFTSAKKRGVPLFVFFSSMSVYGEVKSAVVSESLIDFSSIEETLASLNGYGSSKLLAEDFLATNASNDTKVVVIRLPGVVGRQSDNNFLSKTLKSMSAQRPVIAKNPHASFNNVALDMDVARLCSHLVNNIHLLPTFSVMNFGSQGLWSIRELLSNLKDLLSSRSSIVFEDESSESFTICIEKLKSLGFSPLDVGEVIKEFVARYNQEIHI